MRRQLSRLIFILACLAGAAYALAQEGHPLTGTWTGDWTSASQPRKHLTLVMNWDGKKVDALLNPGPDSVSLKTTVNVSNWIVLFEGDTKDSAGKVTHITAEGRIEDMGSYHRRLIGSWAEGSVKGEFKLTRD